MINSIKEVLQLIKITRQKKNMTIGRLRILKQKKIKQ